MDTKKFLLAAAAGGATLFLTGALIYGWALRAFSLENSTIVVDPDPIFWAMILSQLVMGGFLAYIYGNRASISTFSSGPGPAR